ncbi:septum formation initiator family protein [Bacillus aquiflavi]|uniref:Septum formation initiator family protein n=1 Tax=Bacillus aquiflavi TaxID=2672567 RepID=A0A6B3W5S2_9BACI|nr:septum formation initiator family protein [Bacillus aquiflavi]MBA4538419.1 septum formation initiator family protein [Bacillus aquiflavi]NEY82784.1 septum formation initiator family protein [Bacillus aquiflavi]UAC48238.1 septum formation initiator family protein [Bacillus aquiflavi]
MSVIKKRNEANVTKIQTTYAQQYENAEIKAARRRKLLVRRLVAFFIFVTVVSYIMVSTLISKAATIEAKKEEKVKLEKKLADLKIDQSILESEIEKLNDDEYLAKIARRDYFLSRENEIIFNLPLSEKEKEKETSTE